MWVSSKRGPGVRKHPTPHPRPGQGSAVAGALGTHSLLWSCHPERPSPAPHRDGESHAHSCAGVGGGGWVGGRGGGGSVNPWRPPRLCGRACGAGLSAASLRSTLVIQATAGGPCLSGCGVRPQGGPRPSWKCPEGPVDRGKQRCRGWGGREARRGCCFFHTRLRNSPPRPGQRHCCPGEGLSLSLPMGAVGLSIVLVAICRFLISLQSGDSGGLYPSLLCVQPLERAGTCQNTGVSTPNCVSSAWNCQNLPEHLRVLLGFC